MPANLPKRALIAVTSARAPLADGYTGVFISEAQHPYNVFRAAGFDVTIASEEGHWSPDSLSLTDGFMTPEDRKQYEDPTSEFRAELDKNRKATDLDGGDYSIFFASAGHAALIDFPHATALQGLAATIYKNGGVVSSVCHGPAIFTNLIDPSTSAPLIRGKKITGFTTQAEHEMGIYETLRSWKELLVDEVAEKLGATYVRSEGVWDDFHVVDGRIVTGQNPQSAASTAKAVVQVFEGL